MPGEGSLYKRASDGRWVAAISVGPRGGRTLHTRYARSRAAGRVALDRLRIELGLQPEPGLTTGAYLERWVRTARNIRPTTRHGYEAAIRTHLVPAIGHIRLADLTRGHVEAMLVELEPRMSPKTARNALVVLRRALGEAVRSDLIARNVAGSEFVDAPRVPIVEPRALSTGEVARLLAAARGDRLEALFVTAVGTGLRQGELLGLAWEDLEPERIVVRKELVRIDGRYLRDDPKTERSKRIVPLSPAVATALAAHRERTIAEGFVPTATGPVFTNRRGTALSGAWLTHHFYELLEAAGIPRLPFKNLRTTFASRLDEAGVSELTIATLLGHSRTATTKRHYIAQTPESAVAAIERLVG